VRNRLSAQLIPRLSKGAVVSVRTPNMLQSPNRPSWRCARFPKEAVGVTRASTEAFVDLGPCRSPANQIDYYDSALSFLLTLGPVC